MGQYEHIFKGFPKWRNTQKEMAPGVAWNVLKQIVEWLAGGLEPDSRAKVLKAMERLDKNGGGVCNPAIADPSTEGELYYIIGRVCAYLEFDFSPEVFHPAIMAMFTIARMNREMDIEIEDNKRFGHD